MTFCGPPYFVEKVMMKKKQKPSDKAEEKIKNMPQDYTLAEVNDPISPDDAWIIEHAEELKSELLELAKSGDPRPAQGTVLGRALKMFTTKLVGDEPEPDKGKTSMSKREQDWYAKYEEMKRIGIKNITPGHHLYRWMLRQRQAFRKYANEHPEDNVETTDNN